MKKYFLLYVAFFLGLLIPNLGNAVPDDKVYYYEHYNFRGESYSLSLSRGKTNKPLKGNTSSFMVGKNVKLTIYSESNYQGATAVFYAGEYGRVPSNWDNKIWSMKVERVEETPVVMCYMHDDTYRAKNRRERQGFGIGTWSKKNAGLATDNEISYIYIPEGVEVKIWVDSGRKGASKHFTTPGLKDLIKLNWDNKVSSIQVIRKGETKTEAVDLVWFYEHPCFNGCEWGDGAGQTVKLSARKANNPVNGRVSSFIVGKGVKLTIYSEKNYKGAKAVFYPGSYGKLSCGWDDKIRSVKLEKIDRNTPVVMFYMDDDENKESAYRKRQGLSLGLWAKEDEGLLCDNAITKIVIPPNLKVKVYEHYEGGGASQQFETNNKMLAWRTKDFKSSLKGKISSINIFDGNTPEVAPTPPGLVENASSLAKKYAVLFDFDTDSCYPSPAMYRDRTMNKGLDPNDDMTQCRTRLQMENANTYCRVRHLNHDGKKFTFIMYALYFPKDPNWAGGHRSDWEWAGVWLENGKVKYASYSAHGGGGETKEADDDVNFSGNHLKVVYHKERTLGVQRTRSMRFAHGGESAENEFGWITPTLIEWDRMKQSDKNRLKNHKFDGAHFPLVDVNFFKIMGQYDPGNSLWSDMKREYENLDKLEIGHPFEDSFEEKKKLWKDKGYSN